MQKTSLMTDRVKILTARPTVDGRDYAPELLEQMASAYDPAEYTAVINYEHLFGNLGTVRELKTEKDAKARTCLMARLAPNSMFFSLNAQKTKLFTSVEFTPQFADTGKAYWVGLALTDTPASLGTTEIHLSVSSAKVERSFPSEEMMLNGEDKGIPETEKLNANDATVPGWLTKLCVQVMGVLNTNATHKGVETMTEDATKDAEISRLNTAAAVDPSKIVLGEIAQA